MTPYDSERNVVICDLFGCWNELPIASSADHVEAVEEHPDWEYLRGLFRCPVHSFDDPRWPPPYRHP